MSILQRLDAETNDFSDALHVILHDHAPLWDAETDKHVENILADVRRRGDAALLEAITHFDGWHPDCVDQIIIPHTTIESSLQKISPALQKAFTAAAHNIRTYHQQHTRSPSHTSNASTGYRITALQKIGIYVPGGGADYPSTVLMNAIPAQLAGVNDIVMCTPAHNGSVSDAVMATATMSGIQNIFTIGGAHAIAAMAYGTDTVPRVDKIVGPGNKYVATAKRMLFGRVGVDIIAGPSELVIIADESARPNWIAHDLLAQAEHDTDALVILLATSDTLLNDVYSTIAEILPQLPRRAVASASLKKRGALIKVRNIAHAISIANHIAPEHLHLQLVNADQYINDIQHAGAIFIGHYSAQVFGDYCAGPSHVLPTNGAARFSSPLNVDDFQKKSSWVQCTTAQAAEWAHTAATIARCEGLEAHARAAECRYSHQST